MQRWEQTLYMKQMRQTIDRYQLIEPGDHILVGLSGGKDSGLLFHALQQLRQYGFYDFEVASLTVANGMTESIEALLQYHEAEGHLCYVHEEDFKERLAAGEAEGYSACYTCTRMRKGILKRFAEANAFNKIALGHTRDDFLETLIMNIMQQGRLASIPPRAADKVSKGVFIRPLLLVDESDVSKAVQQIGLPVIKAACPYAASKSRAKADDRIAKLEAMLPGFSAQWIAAIQNIDVERLL
jgi:tRNA(Ile)-lysidine synthase TilS/MesJ